MAGFMLRVPHTIGNGGGGETPTRGLEPAIRQLLMYRPSGLGLHAAFCLQQGEEGRGGHFDKEPYQATQMNTCKIS